MNIIKKIYTMSVLEKAVIFILFFAFSYIAYHCWHHGYFAITRNQKMAAFVRSIRYYQGRKRIMPDFFPTWNYDTSIIPRAKKYGDEIVPLLENEISVEANPFSDNYTKYAAEFLLSNVIKSKASLLTLMNALQSRHIGTGVFENILGPHATACSLPEDCSVDISDQ